MFANIGLAEKIDKQKHSSSFCPTGYDEYKRFIALTPVGGARHEPEQREGTETVF
jgi:hypothetical protein